MDVIALIGVNLKHLRLQRKMTLRQLGDLTGLSGGYLSLLERGQASASLDTLEHIAGCFDVDVSSLFSSTQVDQSPIIIRNYEYEYQPLNNRHFSASLTNFSNSNIRPSIQTIAPTQGELPAMESREGEVFLYVMDGILTLQIDQEISRLYPEDSSHFIATHPHRYWNETQTTTKVFFAHLHNEESSAADK